MDHLTRTALAGELRVETDGKPLYDPVEVRRILADQAARALEKFALHALLVG